jgi:hypothetical protein
MANSSASSSQSSGGSDSLLAEQRQKLQDLLLIRDRMSELEHIKASLMNDSYLIEKQNVLIDEVGLDNSVRLLLVLLEMVF